MTQYKHPSISFVMWDLGRGRVHMSITRGKLYDRKRARSYGGAMDYYVNEHLRKGWPARLRTTSDRFRAGTRKTRKLARKLARRGR